MLLKNSFTELQSSVLKISVLLFSHFQTDQLWGAQDTLAFIFYLTYDQCTNTLILFSS